jgi:hypothetical protein
MLSYKTRKLDDLSAYIAGRADKFSMQMDSDDVLEIGRTSIRILNEEVNHPRILVLQNPSRSTDLTLAGVDTICYVKFSNESTLVDPFVGSFGLLPLLSRGSPYASVDGIAEFVIMKGNLNALSRHLKTVADWEYYAPTLVLNGEYHLVCVEYLPYLDADLAEWIVNDIEWSFLIEYTWALLNLRSNESLMSAAFLGVDGGSEKAVTYWEGKVKEILEKFKKGGVLTYVG